VALDVEWTTTQDRPRAGGPPLLDVRRVTKRFGAVEALTEVDLRVHAHEVLVEQALPLPHEHRADTSLDRAALLIVELLARVGADLTELLGIGIGLPAPVDATTGTVSVPGILRGWDDSPVAAVMATRLGVPVFVDNDANLGALAEAAFGAGRDAGDLVYLKVSSGIGAGLILNGRLYRGSGGLAGELGHVLVDPDGIVCRCGNRGCLETVAGTGALVDLLRRSHGEDLTVEAMLDAARTGDAGCRRVIQDAGRALGQVVATLFNVLNPELVVMGGHLARAGDLLLDGVRESVARAALPEASRHAEVVAGVLGDRAQVLGALALVVSEADRMLAPV
jgi:predicted NBD/HSP70 family sugar kinase